VSCQRVVLCFPVQAHHCQQLAAVHPELEIVNSGQDGVAEALHQADIFIGHAKVPVDWERVVHQGRLKWIQSSAAGLDHCLVPAVVESEIPVTSVAGLFADQVAEQTMALLLGLVRSMPTFMRAQQAREFVRRPTMDLHGMTVGIVGFGGNGQRIAEVLAPWGVRILATDKFPVPPPDHVEAVLPADQLDQLLPEVNVLILAVPLTAETEGMIDASCLSKLPAGSLLINVARGQIVRQDQLVSALGSGQLAAAGLDVTELEPLPKESPLWDMPNVIITPHVGAQSARRIDVTIDFVCENLRRFLAGESLAKLVDKQLGFSVPEHVARSETDRAGES
jgi:phosphoglycerate dehydrogenase-like enzyme